MKKTITHLHAFTHILLATFFIGCLTSCGAAAPAEEPTEPSPPPPESPSQSPLRVWIATSKSTTEIQALVDQRSHEIGLGVEFSASNPSLILAALQESDPPDLILLSTNSPVAFYGSTGLLMDLAGSIDSEVFYPALIDTCTVNGKLFCLPWGADFQMLLWNKDLFTASGLDPESPPTSLEQLTDYADLLTKFGPEGQLEQLGFLPTISTTQTSMFTRMHGGYWISDDGQQITANSQNVLETLLWEQQFYFKYDNENLSTIFPHPVGLESSDHPFYTNTLALVVSDWNQANSDFVSIRNANLNFGTAPIPAASEASAGAHPILLDGAIVIVPVRAPNPEDAIKLLQALSTPEILADSALLLGQLPASPTVFEDLRFQANPYKTIFGDILQDSRGVTAPSIPLSPELDAAMLQIGELVLYQGADPVPLLDQVQSEFAPLLAQWFKP